jgi:ethanolamine-phosphate cytidylyltransferase
VCAEKERLETVRGCKWVDEVVEGVPYVMSEEYLKYVIEKYRIDYVVHGDDPCIVDGKDVYESAKNMGTYYVHMCCGMISLWIIYTWVAGLC